MPSIIDAGGEIVLELDAAQGLAGAPGAPGPAAGEGAVYITAAALSGHRAIAINSAGQAIYASSDALSDALRKAGIADDRLYSDTASGKDADRKELLACLKALREGDTLVVWKLDRLGRSVKQLVDLVGELHKQGVQFRSLTDSIDTGTPSGRFFFHVMASLAQIAEVKAFYGITELPPADVMAQAKGPWAEYFAARLKAVNSGENNA